MTTPEIEGKLKETTERFAPTGKKERKNNKNRQASIRKDDKMTRSKETTSNKKKGTKGYKTKKKRKTTREKEVQNEISLTTMAVNGQEEGGTKDNDGSNTNGMNNNNNNKDKYVECNAYTNNTNNKNKTNNGDNIRGVFRVVLGAISYYAQYLATRKILLKLLRIEIENYSHHHDNGYVSNRTSTAIDLFNTNLSDEI
jgi:hypothetical protein